MGRSFAACNWLQDIDVQIVNVARFELCLGNGSFDNAFRRAPEIACLKVLALC
jgi:hypothetical protein